MKFYGGGVVWDPENSRSLAVFDENGEFVTEDERVISILKASYRYDEPELTKREIMALLEEKGIEYDPKSNKSTLLGLLKG